MADRGRTPFHPGGEGEEAAAAPKLPVYADPDKAYEARRAGLLPADAEADKVVLAKREEVRKKMEAEAQERETVRRRKAGL
jgi:hypothetical protein